MEFPKAEEFTVEPAKTCIKWRDLPIGVYKLIAKLSTRSKFGDGMRLELENVTNEKTFVWAPTRLVKTLNENNAIEFILNNGLKQSDFDSSHSYYSFSTM